MKINDIEKFAQNIESKMFFDYDVKHLNWFNIGGKTQIFFKTLASTRLEQFGTPANQTVNSNLSKT